MATMHQLVVTCVCLALFKTSLAIDSEETSSGISKAGDRKGRLFSVFNVVTFKQAACTSSTDSTVKGTCMSSSECSDASGNSAGSCAAGFGVCCTFIVNSCSSTVSQNCSYITNPDYPNSYSTSGDCLFTFKRICDDLCQIRLDFDTLNLAQPPSSGADTGSCSAGGDTLTVASPTGKNPPVVCGTLSGQHMYLETALTGTNAGTATFSGGTGGFAKSWRVKVTYLQCTNAARAPSDCTQYLTGQSGSFSSYNQQGGQLLQGNIYTTCIRQEEGYCSIQYGEDSFELYGATNIAAAADPGVALTNEGCGEFYIQIPADQISTNFCGEKLSTTSADGRSSAVYSSSTPFEVTTVFGNPATARVTTATTSRAGYTLTYTQIPC